MLSSTRRLLTIFLCLVAGDLVVYLFTDELSGFEQAVWIQGCTLFSVKIFDWLEL